MNCKNCNNYICCWSAEENEIPQINFWEFYKLCKDCYYKKATDKLISKIDKYMEKING